MIPFDGSIREERFAALPTARAGVPGIFLIEDNPADVCLITELLREAPCGIACVGRADRLSEALAGLEAHRPDAVLADLGLPDSQGLETLFALQRRFPALPVVVLTGRDDERFATEAVGAGAQDYLVKGRLTADLLARTVSHAIERARAAQKIREQAALLDNARDGIQVRDLEGCIRYWNSGAERLYGRTSAEAIGRNFEELFPHRDSAVLRQARKEVLERGEWAGELSQPTARGGTVIVESRWTLMRDGEGRPKTVLVIESDITEKRELEARVLQAQRMELIGSLAGGIAHDLNNVLAPILMIAELLIEDVETHESRKMLKTVRHSAERGAEMVKQILSFSRGVRGEQTVVQFKSLIAETCKLFKDTFPRSIEIQTRIQEDVRPVQGHATQMHQVLLNLCVNARDAMPRGGLLRIEAGNETLVDKRIPGRPAPVSGAHVVLKVADTGHGIPPGLIEKIFNPFFTTKGTEKGTGLGLSTVQSIVQAHRGFVEVSSQEGRGTEFRVYLPATDAEILPPSARPPVEELTGRGEQILLIDDELAILESMRETLRCFNYRVSTASNGAEALEIFRQRRENFDAVVTDMRMPLMSGAETVRALRGIDPNVKVICVSGLGSSMAEAREFGARTEADPLANAFLTKPYSCEKLLATLREVLKGGIRAEPAQQAVAA